MTERFEEIVLGDGFVEIDELYVFLRVFSRKGGDCFGEIEFVEF